MGESEHGPREAIDDKSLPEETPAPPNRLQVEIRDGPSSDLKIVRQDHPRNASLLGEKVASASKEDEVREGGVVLDRLLSHCLEEVIPELGKRIHERQETHPEDQGDNGKPLGSV